MRPPGRMLDNRRSIAMADKWFQKGLKIRKQVLGADYVERSLKSADDFTMPVQELATAAGWGMVWSRPGLTKRERSMITIAFAIARSKPEELALHIRGAIRNGVTKTEVREIMLQSGIYCGFPEALTAFRVGREFFANEKGAKPAAKKRARKR